MNLILKRYHLFNIFKKIFKIKKNRILFNSYYAKQYSDNPKWFYEYLLDVNYDGEYIWVLDNKTEYIRMHPRLKIINSKSIQWLYYMATSKLWVINCNLSSNIIPKDETIFLQTWHGTPLKKIGLDITVDNSMEMQAYLKNVREESKNWTYIISPNRKVSTTLKSAFSITDKQILEINYPRNDILIDANLKTNKEKILKKLNIKTDKKIILYAPTFRTNDEIFDLSFDKEKLKEKLNGKYIFLFRKHSNIKEVTVNLEDEEFYYDVSAFDDIQELYIVADILMTDYSSVFFDYALLNRLIIFYPYDKEKYENNLRGFYYDYEQLVPGPIVYNTSEIIKTIMSYENDPKIFLSKIDSFNKQFNKNTRKKGSKELFDLLGLKK